MTFDLLIKDGMVIDGTGKPRYLADIGVKGGRIQDIGAPTLPGAASAKTVPAFGKFVTPGFIDITSHADKNWTIFQNPLQDYLLTQGVTSILVGNCGSSLAPLVSQEAAASLRKWEATSRNINWITVGELLEELARHPLGLNVATLVGHGTLRRGILAGESRRMSAEELAQAVEHLERGIAEGAFGLSTGLVYSHEQPATAAELVALANVLARHDAIYKTHLRHEGADIVPAMNEAVEIARESKAKVIVSHFKAIGRKSWPFFSKALAMIERANAHGRPFHFDVSPYQRTGSFLYLLLPAWAREGGFPAMLERIQNPQNRSAIIEELKRLTLHYDRYIVASSVVTNTNGLTIAEVAEHAGSSPEEAILELLVANGGRVTIFGKTLSFKNIVTGLTHPLGIMASDASGVSAELGETGKLVHPRSTGAFPHFLHRFVREAGLMSWEEGMRKITSLPADAVGFAERGRIAKGHWADLVIFDPEKIRDRSTYLNPYVHSAGIEAVVVNGKLAVENGQLTDVAAGQVLKKS